MGYAPVDSPTAANNNKIKIKEEFEEFDDSFLDSILNFDVWIEENHPNPFLIMNQVEEVVIKKETVAEEAEKLGDLIQDKVCLTSESVENSLTDDLKQVPEVMSADKVDEEEEDEDDKVCLTMESVENSLTDDLKHGLEVKSVDVNEEDADVNEEDADVEEEEEESSSSSSSSSSEEDDSDSDDEEDDSDSDDEDDDKDIKKVKHGIEMEEEEGEIRDELAAVAWSDDDEEGDVVKGPIRSKNEVQDLPPVPSVSVTIQPHHKTLPVGVVLSIMGAQVIVEGVENHNPLSEGSILWFTESRIPLGVVDEIFGPVKNPYYIVRYNSETEIPTGIQQGSLISFVPEFADHVLNNNNNLYKKGYDASGENDEELSDELEFSDDEKEAEYKKMIKMAKRNSSEQKNGNMKKDKKSRNRGGNWKNDQQPSANSQLNGSTSSGPQTFSPRPHAPTSQVNGFSGGPTTAPPQMFSPGPGAPNFTGQPFGVWPNGSPCIQPQNIGFPPNGFPPNIPFMQQNFMQQQPFQNLGLPNFAPFFNPQLNPSGGQMFPFAQSVPPNFGANPAAFASWPGGMPPNQNNMNQSQVGPPMGFQSMNVLPPQGFAMPNNGVQIEIKGGGVRPPFVAAGNSETGQNPNQSNNGFPNRGGRKPFQRGGGRFRGRGRSGPQSR